MSRSCAALASRENEMNGLRDKTARAKMINISYQKKPEKWIWAPHSLLSASGINQDTLIHQSAYVSRLNYQLKRDNRNFLLQFLDTCHYEYFLNLSELSMLASSGRSFRILILWLFIRLQIRHDYLSNSLHNPIPHPPDQSTVP